MASPGLKRLKGCDSVKYFHNVPPGEQGSQPSEEKLPRTSVSNETGGPGVTGGTGEGGMFHRPDSHPPRQPAVLVLMSAEGSTFPSELMGLGIYEALECLNSPPTEIGSSLSNHTAKAVVEWRPETTPVSGLNPLTS